jgi:membrane-associated protein
MAPKPRPKRICQALPATPGTARPPAHVPVGRTEEDRTVDLVRLFDACLHSLWLLPVLAVLIAADGPVPVLPSETILMSAAAAAFGIHDVRGTVGLFAAALVGSVAGDLLAFWLGRSSNRLLPAAAHADSGLGHWVRANLFHRPVVALVGARLLPGGRLVSTAAAGRVGLPLRRFLPGSLVSSAVWSVYMLAVGMLLGPMVGGNPFLSLAAGVVMAVLTAGGFAVIQRLRARRRQATPVADLPPTAAPAAPALVTP